MIIRPFRLIHRPAGFSGGEMSLIPKSSIAMACTALASSLFPVPPGLAQEDTLPTLRIDRIPAAPAFPGQTRAVATDRSVYEVETIASGLSAPWALAFLPGGALYVLTNEEGDAPRGTAELLRIYRN